MSLERIDAYLRDLEAIKNYDVVKKERDEAREKLRILEIRLKNETKKRDRLLTKLDTQAKQITEAKTREDNLTVALQRQETQLQKLIQETQNQKARIQELEHLQVITDGKNLLEAEKMFLQGMEAEIETRSQEALTSMKVEWEQLEKPKEVYHGAINLVNEIIAELNKPTPRYFRSELMQMRLPQKIEAVIGSEVDRRLDEEFDRRVEERSEEKVREKLAILKNSEWPNWMKKMVEPRIKELEEKMNANLLRGLQGPWSIVCDRCGSQESYLLSPQGIEDLLRRGFIRIDCETTNCRSRMRKSLKDLISNTLVSI